MSGFTKFQDITAEEWQRTLDVNLTGTFHCIQAAIGDMVAGRWGRIVTISSAAGQTASPRQAHYSASKGGVIAMTKTLAAEFGRKGITANTVPPFTVDTPMLRAAQEAGNLPPTEVIDRDDPRRAARHRRRHRRLLRLPVLGGSGLHHRAGHRPQRRSSHLMDRFDLTGRVAIITGGGTGIGRGAALVLAEHGADVVLAGRRTGAPRVHRRGGPGPRPPGRRCALPTSPSAEACQQLVDTTLAELGRVDILVNNAGGAETKSMSKWTEDEWLQVLALNLGSVWHLSRAAAKPMLAQGKGAIVNISSGASLLAMPQAAPYAAAKAGVNNLTGSMASAWTGRGVRVNAIAVGAVRAATLVDDLARYGIDAETMGETNASGRLGEPEEIGYGVLFFASDASSFCSGQTLYMHGGPGPAGV